MLETGRRDPRARRRFLRAHPMPVRAMKSVGERRETSRAGAGRPYALRSPRPRAAMRASHALLTRATELTTTCCARAGLAPSHRPGATRSCAASIDLSALVFALFFVRRALVMVDPAWAFESRVPRACRAARVHRRAEGDARAALGPHDDRDVDGGASAANSSHGAARRRDRRGAARSARDAALPSVADDLARSSQPPARPAAERRALWHPTFRPKSSRSRDVDIRPGANLPTFPLSALHPASACRRSPARTRRARGSRRAYPRGVAPSGVTNMSLAALLTRGAVRRAAAEKLAPCVASLAARPSRHASRGVREALPLRAAQPHALRPTRRSRRDDAHTKVLSEARVRKDRGSRRHARPPCPVRSRIRIDDGPIASWFDALRAARHGGRARRAAAVTGRTSPTRRQERRRSRRTTARARMGDVGTDDRGRGGFCGRKPTVSCGRRDDALHERARALHARTEFRALRRVPLGMVSSSVICLEPGRSRRAASAASSSRGREVRRSTPSRGASNVPRKERFLVDVRHNAKIRRETSSCGRRGVANGRAG